MESRADQALQVGEFLVEPSLNRLGRGRADRRVPPRAMAVLLQLAASAGRVVERRALLERVWPDSVASEDLLNRAVADLRKAFGDRPGAPRYIETIPKAGYRLVAPVASAGPAAPSPASRPAPRRSLLALASAAGVIAGLVAVAPLTGRTRGDAPAPAQVRLLTSHPGIEAHPSVAPDATRVAYVRSAGEGDWDVWLREFHSGEERRVTAGPEADLRPAWSPDGERLAWLRYAPAGRAGEPCAIWSAAAAGGAARRLASCGQSANPDLVWSPDGRWLAFSDRPPGAVTWGVQLLDPASGESRRLVGPEAPHWGDRDPSFSPDSRSVAFTRSTSRATQELWRIEVAGGPARRLTDDRRALHGHTWSADGRWIVFVSERRGRPELWRIAAEGGAPQWLPLAVDQPRRPASAGPGRLLLESWSFDSELRSAPLPDGEPGPPLAASTRSEQEPDQASDGRLAFVSDRSGRNQIWVLERDGRVRQLTALDSSHTGCPRWSPDASAIAFDSRRDGRADVYLVAAAGGAPRRVTPAPGDDLEPAWSPDGRWLYFSSNRDGSWQLWRVAAAGGEPERVTREGGYAPRCAADGTLFYGKFGEKGLYRRAPGAPEVPVTGGEGFESWARCGVAADGLYCALELDQESWLVRLDAAGPHRIRRLPGRPDAGLSVGAGRVVWSERVRSESDLVLALLDGAAG